jgi:hypothetical protein
MNHNPKPNHDDPHNNDRDPVQDRDPAPANDNGDKSGSSSPLKSRAMASTTAGGALASLAALRKALAGVDTISVVGRSGLPILQLKREGGGVWAYGQKRTVVEAGSYWAANPESFKWGYICFDNDNKPTERMVPVTQPKPDITQLPDTGFEWQEQWSVNMKCLSGTDAGLEVTYKQATVGALQAVAGLLDTVRDKLDRDPNDANIVPIVILEKDSYQHGQHGKVWTPVLTIIGWTSFGGPPSEPPKPTPKPEAPQATPEPRRRRVAA